MSKRETTVKRYVDYTRVNQLGKIIAVVVEIGKVLIRPYCDIDTMFHSHLPLNHYGGRRKEVPVDTGEIKKAV
ncbi:hypothetical protein L1887_25592 [Cichorium endivia]|nr:hypothetical protein L1887_25592 [Cichorium endivia]